MRVNPVQIIQQVQSDFPLGNLQPLYLDNFPQAKPNDQQQMAMSMGENKFPAFNFELNRPIQGLENWNFNLDNLRSLASENERLNQLRLEENANANEMGKRKSGNNIEEMENYSKKVKQNPLGISDTNIRQKGPKKDEMPNYQNRFAGGNNLGNVYKNEGNL